VNNNTGCAVTDQSYFSSGPTLGSVGGGVFAMKWDDTGISVWFFPRPIITNDITNLIPQPSLWGEPTAYLSPDDCNIEEDFQSHVIAFNIAFCGDQAGASYLTSGCPGTCSDQIMNPSNFNESIWVINSLRVYTNRDLLVGQLSQGLPTAAKDGRLRWRISFGLCISILMSISGWL